MKIFNKLILFIVVALFTTACENVTKFARNQNIPLNALAIEKVTVGMSKEEVLMLLGPAHINPKKPDVWTYLYIERGIIKDKIFMILFEEGKVLSYSTRDVKKKV